MAEENRQQIQGQVLMVTGIPGLLSTVVASFTLLTVIIIIVFRHRGQHPVMLMHLLQLILNIKMVSIYLQ